jgi:hypothetical protein
MRGKVCLPVVYGDLVGAEAPGFEALEPKAKVVGFPI